MRRLLTPALLLALALAVSSCVPSLHELITDDLAAFEPSLVGIWSTDGNGTTLTRLPAGTTPEDDTWLVEKSGDKGYTAKLTSAGHPPQIFDMRFARLSSGTYVELTPTKRCACDDDDFTNFFFVRGHGIFKVTVAGDAVTVLPLDPDWLEAHARSGNIHLSFEKVDDVFLITATSRQLLRFIERHGNDPGVFAKVDVH